MKYLLLSAVLLGFSAQTMAQTVKVKKTTTFTVDEEKTKVAREEQLEELEEKREGQFKEEEKQLEEAQKEQEKNLEQSQEKQTERLKQNQEDLAKVLEEDEAKKQPKEVRGTFKVKTEKTQ